MRFYSPETLKRVEVDEKGIAEALASGLVPSVSEVLSILDKGEHLLKWKIKNCLNFYERTGDREGAESYQDTTSADYGTVCHGLAEAYLENKEPEVEYTQSHVKTIEPFKRWVDDNVQELVFSEKFFADGELGYGGTADMLLKLKDGTLLLGDLKVKKESKNFPLKPNIEYLYQLSAYRAHFKKEYGDMEIGNLLLVSPFTYGFSKAVPIPRIDPFIYYGQDWTDSFQAAFRLWVETKTYTKNLHKVTR
jgi:hypothetical protein